jgi:hypothetical protein
MTIKIEPRKIFQAGGSFQASFPMVWIKHHQLGRNSKVEMSISDGGELIIKPIKNETEKTTEKD